MAFAIIIGTAREANPSWWQDPGWSRIEGVKGVGDEQGLGPHAS
jgi:hypothetical protein